MSRIAVGIIRRAHGVHGEASVEPWTNSLDRFSELRDVTLVSPGETTTRQVRIEAVRQHRGRALITFAGIVAPEEIASLQDWTIEIPESQARRLEPGEYFLHDLVGLTLVDAEGREQGTVVDTSEGGGGLLLTVKQGARTFEVPFAAEICTEIDLGRKRIVVSLPEGLDEI